MLNGLDINNLLDIFSNPENTFDHILKEFKKVYSYDRFKVCYGLSIFLTENMLTQLQRYCTIYVTILSFPGEHANNQHPFAGVILDLIANNKINSMERKFAYELYNRNNVYSQKIIKDVLKELENEAKKQQFVLPEKYTQLKDAFQQNAPKLSGFKKQEVLKIVPDFGEVSIIENQPMDKYISTEQILAQDFTTKGFQPDFLRPVPEPLQIKKEDYLWIQPGVVHDLIWDPIMCRKQIIHKQLWDKALNERIKNNEEIMFLNEHLQNMKDPLNEAPISVDNISKLISKNPLLAYKFLYRIHSSKDFTKYLDPLISQKCTLESFECMHKLLQNIDFPKEFQIYYLTGCIAQIEKLKDQPFGIQQRMVRLLSTFLRSLIKSKTLNPIDMFIELQTFCINNIEVQEAASLFKMLKGIVPENYNVDK